MPKGILEDLVEIVGIAPPANFPEIDDDTWHTQIAVDELLELPLAKPDIEQLLNVHVNVEITRTKMINTPIGYKAVVRGVIKQKIVYVADVPEQSLHAAHFEKPFCTFIPIPKDEKDEDWDKDEKQEARDVGDVHARAIIEDVLITEFGKRHIHQCAILFIWLE